MQSYKLSVSKNGKKYTIVFKAENEIIAKQRVHNEWYSILSIEEEKHKELIWNIFIFSWYNNLWELKNWKIVWDDIFKVYVKLRKNLEYNVELLYSEADIDLPQSDKHKIIKNLEEEYNLFFKSKENKESNDKDNIQLQKFNQDTKNKNWEDNFYMKKELDETYKLVSLVLEKLNKLISWETQIELDNSQKEKLDTIYNLIVKFKKTTNISKLREICELALLKIWNIELYEIENKHKENSEVLLKETNQLLKKIWSKKNFILKNKDVIYQAKNFFNNVFWKFNTINKQQDNVKSEEEKIDKHSHSYIKNILFLKKYKEKLKENNAYILKNIFSILLNSEKRLDIFIRRKVIKQNIILFKAKEKWIWFSYTTLKNWFKGLENFFLFIIKTFRSYIFIVIYLYTILFIIYLNINYYFYINELNYKWIFLFIIVYFIYLVLYFTRNLFLIILNFVFLFFIIIFWVVNF